MVARIQQIPQFKRSSIRRLGHLSNVPKSTLQRFLKRSNARSSSVWIKPSLSCSQRLERLRWVVQKVQKFGRRFQFEPFYHTVHIDEKWCTLLKGGTRAWILPDEAREAAPTASRKTRLPKVMFLAADGRPHMRNDNTKFSGLIGIWHFVQVASA